MEVGVRIVARRETVREKGGGGKDGTSIFHHKSPTVCQGQHGTILSHPRISRLFPIKSQFHPVRLAFEGQIRLPHIL